MGPLPIKRDHLRSRGMERGQYPILCENITKTHCYHFATQLGSTGWYRLEQGRALRQNSVNNSVLARTRQNTKRWPQPNFECGALSRRFAHRGPAEFDALLGERRKWAWSPARDRQRVAR
jgi:hypothetical protein